MRERLLRSERPWGRRVEEAYHVTAREMEPAAEVTGGGVSGRGRRA